MLWKRSGPADIEGSSLHPLPQCLFLSYHTASFTLRKASVHLYFSGLPIDLWVVVLEPGITKDHVLLSEAGDSKKRPFGVNFVVEDYVYNFRDLACLVGGAVHVVHWYGARDALGVNTFHMDEVSIYEVARMSQLCHGPVVTYCMVYHYTKRATLARLLANKGPAIYVVHLNRYFVIPP